MFLIDRRIRTVESRHAVHIRICDIIRISGFRDAVRVLLLFSPEGNHALGERQRLVVLERRFIHQFHIVGIVGNHVIGIFWRLDTEHTAIIYMEGIFLFPLGSDEDDTVRSPVSIYGTGCGIFEH